MRELISEHYSIEKAHFHAQNISKRFNSLVEGQDWEYASMTWKVKEEKLKGNNVDTLRSQSLNVAGIDIFLRLEIHRQSDPVIFSLCAASPRWAPVSFDSLSVESSFVDDKVAGGTFGAGKLSIEKETDMIEIEEEPYHGFSGNLMIGEHGEIVETDGDSESDGEFEFSDKLHEMTRADLLKSGVRLVETDVNGQNVRAARIIVTFRIRKTSAVTVNCI